MIHVKKLKKIETAYIDAKHVPKSLLPYTPSPVFVPYLFSFLNHKHCSFDSLSIGSMASQSNTTLLNPDLVQTEIENAYADEKRMKKWLDGVFPRYELKVSANIFEVSIYLMPDVSLATRICLEALCPEKVDIGESYPLSAPCSTDELKEEKRALMQASSTSSST